MIKTIALTNFRRHTDQVFNFGPGLQVIRGVNESGKSTAYEGAAYALFGSRALRNTFDDTVTWGCKPSTLKSVTTIEIDGVDYVFSRSKAGAECTYAGGMVTGQNEVSAFATKLLGADGPTAGLLMLSHQGALRGALEAGPRAVSEMIEQLADFDLFETIIERMQEKLVLGATGPTEAQIESLREEIENLPALTAPNTEAVEAKIKASRDAVAEGEKWVSTVGQAEYNRAETALKMAEYQMEQHVAADARLKSALGARSGREAQLASMQHKASLRPDPEALTTLRQALEQGKTYAKNSALLARMTALNAYSDAAWDGDIESLDKAIAKAESDINEGNLKVTQLSGDIRVARAKMVMESQCGFCHQDVSQFPEVAKRNQEAEAEVKAKEAESKEVAAGIFAAKADMAELKSVKSAAAPFLALVGLAGGLITASTNYVPPHLVWAGPKLGAEPDLNHLQAEIARLTKETADADMASMWVHSYTESLAEDQERINTLEAQLVANPAPAGIAPLEQEKGRAASELWERRMLIGSLSNSVAEMTAEIRKAQAEFEAADAKGTALVTRLAEAKAHRDTLNFNNALLKKIRQARPIISDKLWNTVLSAVSTMFSQMRGETSVVAKGKDGFTVNGASFTSLSGSTLDLLGLAIRIALVKTFIPRCSFLILDEPFAACDEERSSRMLGFIAASGFAQTIVITHEENSEAVADNLVFL